MNRHSKSSAWDNAIFTNNREPGLLRAGEVERIFVLLNAALNCDAFDAQLLADGLRHVRLTEQLCLTDAAGGSDNDIVGLGVSDSKDCMHSTPFSATTTMACMSNLTLVEMGAEMARVVSERDLCEEEAAEVFTFERCAEEGTVVAVGVLLLQVVAVALKQGEWGGEGEVITTV